MWAALVISGGIFMNTFKLTKPISISDSESTKEVNELPYDFDSMTAKDKINAGKAFKAAGMSVAVEELDPDYHIYLFAQAVHVVSPNIEISDVLRMSAKDSQKAGEEARRFFYLSSAV